MIASVRAIKSHRVSRKFHALLVNRAIGDLAACLVSLLIMFYVFIADHVKLDWPPPLLVGISIPIKHELDTTPEHILHGMLLVRFGHIHIHWFPQTVWHCATVAVQGHGHNEKVNLESNTLTLVTPSGVCC